MKEICVDLSIYPLEIVQRACHGFTGRCFAHLARDGESMRVQFAPRDTTDELADIADRFANALLDQTLRVAIAAETSAIRELIVAQAFAEADLLDRRDAESDYELDVRRIGTTR